jgi:hypothetical protein
LSTKARISGRVVGYDADLPAVVQRHHRFDLLADRAQHQGQQVLGAFDHVGVGEFLVQDDDVGQTHALQREMAVRIEFDADHAVRPTSARIRSITSPSVSS